MVSTVIKQFVGFYRRGPERPWSWRDPLEVRRLYERKRWMVFSTITVGYGFFYLCRLSLSVVKKPLIDEGILDARQMGFIGAASLFTYAIGKLINGFLSDVVDVRKFMSTGLLCSAVLNLGLGWTESFLVFAMLWGLNGWFQSMGSAPSVVSISQWFSHRERGTRYGIWSIAHNIGEGLTFALTSVMVSALGWRWGFWGPGCVCVVAALVMYMTHSDRPESLGLPPIATYKNDHSVGVSSQEPLRSLQLGVLKNRAVWILGISSALMYVARYGINNWGILYLQEAKKYTLVDAGSLLALCTMAGIVGTVSSGYVSDRWFNARRNVPVLLYGIMEVGALILFYCTPAGHRWIDMAAMSAFGFAIGGLLVFLGGLMAVDICPKKVTGAAMGLVGMVSYVGAAIQDVASGHLIGASRTIVAGHPTYNFEHAFYVWIGASVVSLLLTCTLWNVKHAE